MGVGGKGGMEEGELGGGWEERRASLEKGVERGVGLGRVGGRVWDHSSPPFSPTAQSAGLAGSARTNTRPRARTCARSCVHSRMQLPHAHPIDAGSDTAAGQAGGRLACAPCAHGGRVHTGT